MTPLVAKVGRNSDKFIQECDAMKKFDNIVLDSGKIDEEYSYIITPRYGTNLKQILCKNELNKLSVMNVARFSINWMKKIHEAGYTYNNLKPENILVDFDPDLKDNQLIGTNLNLIGFGSVNPINGP